MVGIIIDIVFVALIALSTYLGYKKGLVKLGARLIAGIVAIIVTLVLCKPVGDIVINNTPLDENLESAILENANKFVEDRKENKDGITVNVVNNIQENVLPSQARTIATSVVYIGVGICLYIVVKILLSIIISLLDLIAKIPVLKQFNEIGGTAYGLLRGALLVCVIILIMGAIIKTNPESSLNEKINETYLTKFVYQNIVKF